MKSQLLIFIYVALLPTIINGEKTPHEYWQDVQKISNEGGTIEGIFEPKKDGLLGSGFFAFVCRGILLPIKTEIAMKFTIPENASEAENEYQMYSYLDAINNPRIERYGIPVVYYYGKWNENNVIMMGITLLEKNLHTLGESQQLLEHDVNTLIIVRDFILSSKYMHSRGVRHDCIRPLDVMVRKHRTFLIDFDRSSKMNVQSFTGVMDYMSKRAHSTGIRYPKDDWESFLYTICDKIGVDLPWIKYRGNFAKYMNKSNTPITILKINNIRSITLRNILVKLSQHIFENEFFTKDHALSQLPEDSDDDAEMTVFDLEDKTRFPDYDRFYKLFDKEIAKTDLPKPVMFTWLTPEERAEAIEDLEKNPTPNIADIPDPKSCDYSTMIYPVADPDYFVELYKDWNASSSQTFVPGESSHGPSKRSGESRSPTSPSSSADTSAWGVGLKKRK